MTKSAYQGEFIVVVGNIYFFLLNHSMSKTTNLTNSNSHNSKFGGVGVWGWGGEGLISAHY